MVSLEPMQDKALVVDGVYSIESRVTRVELMQLPASDAREYARLQAIVGQGNSEILSLAPRPAGPDGSAEVDAWARDVMDLRPSKMVVDEAADKRRPLLEVEADVRRLREKGHGMSFDFIPAVQLGLSIGDVLSSVPEGAIPVKPEKP